jgi:hypothetical protein
MHLHGFFVVLCLESAGANPNTNAYVSAAADLKHRTTAHIVYNR